MTFKQLKEKGLKKIFLKNIDEIECEKWELIGRFILSTKNKDGFKDARCVNMYIYYYDDTNCYVEMHCKKTIYNKDIDMSMKEIVEYQYFFTHIFDVDEYVIA